MAKVADFVEKVASDEAFEREFLADPEGAVEAFGLDKHQQDVILNGTAKKIKEEVEKGRAGAETFAIRVKMR
jgi:hypothetical protein